jgi:DnaJ family protein C protein 13
MLLAAARLLAPGEGQPAGQAAFALFGKTGRSPRVYCCTGRDALLKAIQVGRLALAACWLAAPQPQALAVPPMLLLNAPPRLALLAPQTAALRKLGLTLAVDSGSGNQLSGAQLLAAVAAAERERAGTAGDAPLGEWEVLKVKDVDAGGFCTMQMESGGFGWKVGPGWKDLSGREVN